MAAPSDLDAVGIVEIDPATRRVTLRRRDGLVLGVYAILGEKGSALVPTVLLVAPAASVKP